jgi:hypothetical protein
MSTSHPTPSPPDKDNEKMMLREFSCNIKIYHGLSIKYKKINAIFCSSLAVSGHEKTRHMGRDPLCLLYCFYFTGCGITSMPSILLRHVVGEA